MTTLLLVPVGFFIGTLAEWFVHWLFHKVPFLWEQHRLHHENPRDRDIGGSWAVHILTVGVIVFFLSLASGWLGVGFTLWYAAYAALHYYDHQISARKASWIDHFQDHHIEHHNDASGVNYGVTTFFWDRLFGTYKPGVDHNAG